MTRFVEKHCLPGEVITFENVPGVGLVFRASTCTYVETEDGTHPHPTPPGYPQAHRQAEHTQARRHPPSFF